MKRILLQNKRLGNLLILILLSAFSVQAQPVELLLWPKGAPHTKGKTSDQTVRVAENGERFLNNINKPSITAYIPSKGASRGVAVILAPGGGHRELRIDTEGYMLAQRFQDKGIAAFVLKYRLPNEAGSTYTEADELSDIQRAIRMVKSRATEWAIDTASVGVMGFSAGGELAGLAAMRFENNKTASDVIDRFSARPSFQALIYPGGTTRLDIVPNIPPIFLASGYKDRADIAAGVAKLYLKYKEAGVKADLHIYSEAGHGFAADPTSKNSDAGWMDLFVGWLSDLGFLKKN